MWDVEYTDEFGEWWESLGPSEQASLDASVRLLEQFGPHLCRPLRTFYAFDPRQCAILLIGGDKTGDDRFYERMIPLVDRLYDEYLDELRKEGLI